MEYRGDANGPTGHHYATLEHAMGGENGDSDDRGADHHNNMNRAPELRNEPPSKRRRRTSDHSNGFVSSSLDFFSPDPSPPAAATVASAEASSIISPERQFSFAVGPQCTTNSSSAVHLFTSDAPPVAASRQSTLVVTQLSQDTTVSDAESTSHHQQQPVQWWKQRPSSSGLFGRVPPTAAAASGGARGNGMAASSSSAVTCHVCNTGDPYRYAQSGQIGSSWQSFASRAAAFPATATSSSGSTMETNSAMEAATSPPRQKNSLLSYFQVRSSSGSNSSGPSRPSAAAAGTGRPSTATAAPATRSDDGPPAPGVLTCAYCERPTCASCSRNCESCAGRYCTFCSTVNYDEARAERIFCLDCDATASSSAQHGPSVAGVVVERGDADAGLGGGGCMDMEE
mmetsp:Transcript_20136/g.41043  ORF Transcript_20136/g.41043 Transcript_20136/m.41043 type:complete len:399 (-) Transcript_20136:548-1744(-)